MFGIASASVYYQELPNSTFVTPDRNNFSDTLPICLFFVFLKVNYISKDEISRLANTDIHTALSKPKIISAKTKNVQNFETHETKHICRKLYGRLSQM